MLAQEMFEKIGYKQIIKDYFIEYVFDKDGKQKISFRLDEKIIDISSGWDFEYQGSICVEELKAIIQQCKEMGWLNVKFEVLDEINEMVDRATSSKVSYEGDGYDDKGELIYDTAICPSCGRKFEVDYDEQSDYCPSCGQKLDWMVANY